MLILYLIFLIILLLYVVQDVVLDLHSQLKISFIDLQSFCFFIHSTEAPSE